MADDFQPVSWASHIVWTGLGLIGAGISVGVRLSRGEKLNPYALSTTLIAGMAVSGTCTQALVNFASISAGWAGGVALLLGLMAMGFVNNALDGKIPFINRYMGNQK
jgi:hypothetical protein